MIFESLADRLQQTFKKLRGHGKLTEDDVNEAMREVRMALLEADVNFKVVKDFVKRVKERAVGQDVLDTLTPAQVVVKIVDEELTELMGGTQSRLNISSVPPTVIMMAGLQGAGKTTSAGRNRCSSPPTSIDPPPSSRSKSSADSSAFPSFPCRRARTP